MNEDWESVRLKAFFRCGMSFRLTPKAHRKHRLAIRTKGTRNQRSVKGIQLPACGEPLAADVIRHILYYQIYVRARSKCVYPASTKTCCAVMWLACSEIKNRTIAAISSGVVIRLPNGIFDTISASFFSGSGNVDSHCLYRGVFTSAGTIAFTRMP